MKIIDPQTSCHIARERKRAFRAGWIAHDNVTRAGNGGGRNLEQSWGAYQNGLLEEAQQRSADR